MSPDALQALTDLAAAADPTAAGRAAAAARRALGADAPAFEGLLETLTRRAEDVSRLGQLAGCDELTGIANRRALNAALGREIARLERGGHGPALVLLDLDGLKQINDQLGHAAGDAAIVAAAEALASTVRGSDLAARLGGDELAVLLPSTSEEGARAVAERVRRAIEAREVHGRKLRVSVGWAVADRMGIDAEALTAFADARLYADKKSRRPSRSPSRIAA